eukprot:1177145-Prorocentrum_minimum.AAC.1
MIERLNWTPSSAGPHGADGSVQRWQRGGGGNVGAGGGRAESLGPLRPHRPHPRRHRRAPQSAAGAHPSRSACLQVYGSACLRVCGSAGLRVRGSTGLGLRIRGSAGLGLRVYKCESAVWSVVRVFTPSLTTSGQLLIQSCSTRGRSTGSVGVWVCESVGLGLRLLVRGSTGPGLWVRWTAGG